MEGSNSRDLDFPGEEGEGVVPNQEVFMSSWIDNALAKMKGNFKDSISPEVIEEFKRCLLKEASTPFSWAELFLWLLNGNINSVPFLGEFLERSTMYALVYYLNHPTFQNTGLQAMVASEIRRRSDEGTYTLFPDPSGQVCMTFTPGEGLDEAPHSICLFERYGEKFDPMTPRRVTVVEDPDEAPALVYTLNRIEYYLQSFVDNKNEHGSSREFQGSASMEEAVLRFQSVMDKKLPVHPAWVDVFSGFLQDMKALTQAKNDLGQEITKLKLQIDSLRNRNKELEAKVSVQGTAEAEERFR